MYICITGYRTEYSLPRTFFVQISFLHIIVSISQTFTAKISLVNHSISLSMVVMLIATTGLSFPEISDASFQNFISFMIFENVILKKCSSPHLCILLQAATLTKYCTQCWSWRLICYGHEQLFCKCFVIYPYKQARKLQATLDGCNPKLRPTHLLTHRGEV